MEKDNFIFGTRAVLEAVDSGKQIEKVLINQEE
jgi:tRNA G18 (ribose-2'-O)-methylase SpoU